ncbi:MAG: TonB-dependent receptor plug domain-containing protein [Desulfobacterales bacterium]|nr:TonB-dependent receptor plug domain-containing protein [Desulfobacterales bacterium]MBF0397574.1 TonB-dependent receptor plug domain-containing protein [Desulfobacterales bacterium]
MITLKSLLFCILILISYFLIMPNLYAKDKKSITPENIFSMSLEEMLNYKVTTAGKKDEKISEIPASVIIITRKDIERYGYMNLGEILQNIPGMYAIDDLTYGPTFGVRGYWTGYPRNIIFLVNGVNQMDGLFGYYLTQNFSIPVEAIDKIEIVRGPMSVIYGGGAFFGAINIITNDVYGSNDVNIASFSTDIITTKKGAVRMVGSEGDLDFAFNAGYLDSEGTDEDVKKMMTDPSKLDNYGINSTNNTTKGRLELDSKYISFYGKYNGFYANMSFNQSVDEIYYYMPTAGSGSPYNRTMTSLLFGYKKKITDVISIDSKISYNNSSVSFDFDLHPPTFKGYNPGNTRGTSEYYELELDTYFDINSALKLTTGLYFQQTIKNHFSADAYVLNTFMDAKVTDNINNWAFFLQTDYSPIENLKFVAGVRFDQLLPYDILHINNPGQSNYSIIKGSYEQDEIEIIPRFATIYNFNEKNIIKFLYGKAICRPSFFQNRDQIMYGNPALDPEDIQTFELNYISIINKQVTLHSSYFHNILENLIVRTITPSGSSYISSFSNGGKLVTDGIEFICDIKPFKDFQMQISSTWQDTRNKTNGFEDITSEYSPKWLGKMKFSYTFHPEITLSIDGTYVGSMLPKWDVTKNNYKGGRIGQEVDGYYLLGANFRIDNLFGKGYYFNLRGSNILGKDYLYPAYVNNTWADKGVIGEPRLFLATIGWKF